MKGGIGLPPWRDWTILTCIKFSRAREPEDLSSPLAAKVFIGAWIAASIGKKLRLSGARDFGSSVTEDGTGAIYLGLALGRPNTWLRKQRADAAIFVSKDGGAHWDSATAALSGGVMAMCPAVGGEGVFASTSEGDVLAGRLIRRAQDHRRAAVYYGACRGRVKNLLARDLQQELVPSLDRVGVFIGRQTLLRIPALETGVFARRTVAVFF